MDKANNKTMNKVIAKPSNKSTALLSNSNLTLDQQKELLLDISKGANTGVSSLGDAVMLQQRAQELGIGFASAVGNMQVIKGKVGLGIHIIKGILDKPGTGINFEVIEDYRKIYQVFDAKARTYSEDDDIIKEDAVIVPLSKIKEERNDGKFNVSYVVDGKGNRVLIDCRTTYKFTRKKLDIDGTYINKTITSSFSYNDAMKAQLPLDKNGVVNPDSGWAKYTKIMLSHRAFIFGAREIASDLLLGTFETTELYDMENMNYDLDGDKVTLLDADGNPITPEIK